MERWKGHYQVIFAKEACTNFLRNSLCHCILYIRYTIATCAVRKNLAHGTTGTYRWTALSVLVSPVTQALQSQEIHDKPGSRCSVALNDTRGVWSFAQFSH